MSVTCALDTYGGTEYKYLNGTSMAAPHVSGVAGLVLSDNPAYTYSEMRAAILHAVDPIGSLAGEMLTGGRLNANVLLYR